MLQTPEVLPRVFVPQRVERLYTDSQVLQGLHAADFDPREVAYVMDELTQSGTATGSARILEEIPTRVSVEAELDAPGLVVLADRWDAGWRAELDGP